jgi:2-polyprenyl-3-methyl-5-hydroxy-6-metoxy-1,4-benzoquinol methylase
MNIYLREFVKKTKPKTAFDFGCGEGFDMAMLKHLGVDVKGADLPELDMNYPQEVGQYDLVYSNYVLPFVDNKKNFVDNLNKNLKKGGHFFVATFSKNDEIIKNRGTTKEELLKLFEGRDFRNIAIEDYQNYDNEPKHNHWHKLLIIKGKK